ncbi:MAG TPA: ATP-binding protein [Bacteroidales bacterium]|nr:ATP-binding protein [Bacteroidales bacterium]HOZ30511.1 ATP-binding protein [Bacteroidales bacterium]
MEIAVISGKGGTGKSSISAAFASEHDKIVLADCDVDAANLYIIFEPEITEKSSFIGAQKAEIDYSKCTNCGTCIDYCRFDAIKFDNGKVVINEIFCDGCKLCSRICPENAISMIDNAESLLLSGNFRHGKMVYGRLAPGEENSGRLVNLVRDKAKKIAEQNNIETIIIDGPPGIGCPVISTITGVDHVVVVTEPSLSGMHDLKRTLELTNSFNLKTWVIINKFDLNSEFSDKIVEYCNHEGIDVLAKLPYDKQIVDAMVNCKSITEYLPDAEISKIIKIALNKIINF